MPCKLSGLSNTSIYILTKKGRSIMKRIKKLTASLLALAITCAGINCIPASAIHQFRYIYLTGGKIATASVDYETMFPGPLVTAKTIGGSEIPYLALSVTYTLRNGASNTAMSWGSRKKPATFSERHDYKRVYSVHSANAGTSLNDLRSESLVVNYG